VQTANG
jgi:transposase